MNMCAEEQHRQDFSKPCRYQMVRSGIRPVVTYLEIGSVGQWQTTPQEPPSWPSQHGATYNGPVVIRQVKALCIQAATHRSANVVHASLGRTLTAEEGVYNEEGGRGRREWG